MDPHSRRQSSTNLDQLASLEITESPARQQTLGVVRGGHAHASALILPARYPSRYPYFS
jgi:hypothetical protein